jgi:hypothetical protein
MRERVNTTERATISTEAHMTMPTQAEGEQLLLSTIGGDISAEVRAKSIIGSGSTIDYSNALTSQGGCPSGGGGDVIVQGNSSLTTGVDSSGSTSQLYQRATVALFNKDYTSSSSLCRLILRSNASVTEKQQAMVRLLSVFLQMATPRYFRI